MKILSKSGIWGHFPWEIGRDGTVILVTLLKWTDVHISAWVSSLDTFGLETKACFIFNIHLLKWTKVILTYKFLWVSRIHRRKS
jgi:hypothetical protein